MPKYISTINSLLVIEFTYSITQNKKLDDKWLDGYIIIKQNGPVSFTIKHQKSGNVLKAHANDLRLYSLPDNWHIPKSDQLGQRAKYFTVSSDSETDDEPNNTA